MTYERIAPVNLAPHVGQTCYVVATNQLMVYITDKWADTDMDVQPVTVYATLEDVPGYQEPTKVDE